MIFLNQLAIDKPRMNYKAHSTSYYNKDNNSLRTNFWPQTKGGGRDLGKNTIFDEIESKGYSEVIVEMLNRIPWKLERRNEKSCPLASALTQFNGYVS
ncbi:hypothetical protein OUZ56_009687 [Daphnia magna]|uniref:Uncharacterized protein n=1 Tax=Daphnia magna TaxID=35525 RepID=A0ABR0AGQ4_9CRUS|nr:hypothetical protein OUZ56_009687 [Daphnia magna]